MSKDIRKELRKDREKRLAELKETIAENNPEAKFAHGYDDALAGYSSDAKAIYYAEKILKILEERDGMTPDEAIEFFDFNIAGAYVGEYTPIYMYEE